MRDNLTHISRSRNRIESFHQIFSKQYADYHNAKDMILISINSIDYCFDELGFI